MAKLEFESLGSKSQREDLVTETDPIDRLLLRELARSLVRCCQDSRIAGPIGEEDAVGMMRECFLRRGGAGHHQHTHPVGAEQSQDVSLHAEIEENNKRFLASSGYPATRSGLLTLWIPLVGGLGGDLSDQIQLFQAGSLTGTLDRSLLARSVGGDTGTHGTLGTEMARQ